MKYYNLFIHFENSSDTYNAITAILKVEPKPNTLTKANPDLYTSWWFQVEERDDDPPFDFINNFLDLLEPNFEKLSALGIAKSDILIWLVYEYDKQCAIALHPSEMKRLGLCGISLNIDCFEIKEEAS